jgi:hypothetical protein
VFCHIYTVVQTNCKLIFLKIGVSGHSTAQHSSDEWTSCYLRWKHYWLGLSLIVFNGSTCITVILEMTTITMLQC